MAMQKDDRVWVTDALGEDWAATVIDPSYVARGRGSSAWPAVIVRVDATDRFPAADNAPASWPLDSVRPLI